MGRTQQTRENVNRSSLIIVVRNTLGNKVHFAATNTKKHKQSIYNQSDCTVHAKKWSKLIYKLYLTMWKLQQTKIYDKTIVSCVLSHSHWRVCDSTEVDDLQILHFIETPVIYNMKTYQSEIVNSIHWLLNLMKENSCPLARVEQEVMHSFQSDMLELNNNIKLKAGYSQKYDFRHFIVNVKISVCRTHLMVI